MPDRNDFSIPTVETPDQRVKREAVENAERERQAGNINDQIDAAMRGTIPFSLGRSMARAMTEYDPNFRLTPKLIDELTDGIEPDHWRAFADVQSLQEAYAVRSTMLDSADRRRTLSAAGASGFVAQSFADLTDPANILIGLATGGGSQSLKLATLAKHGFIAGASFAAPQIAARYGDPSITGGEIAATFAGGFGFGAAAEATASLGRLARAPIVGLASAVGPSAVLASTDHESNQIQDAFWTSFAAGSVFGAIPGKRSSLLSEFKNRQRESAMRGSMRQQADVIKSVGPEFITPKGAKYVAEQMKVAVARQDAVLKEMDLPQEAAEAIKGSVGTGQPTRDTTLANMFAGSGKAISDNYYEAMLTRLKNGKEPMPFPANQQPADAIAVKEAFKKGEVASVDDARRVAEQSRAVPSTDGSEIQGSVGAATQKEIAERLKVEQYYRDRRAMKGQLAWDASPIAMQGPRKPTFAKYITKNIGGVETRIPLTRWAAGDVVGGSDVPLFVTAGAMMYPDPIPREGQSVFYDGNTWKNSRINAEHTAIEKFIRENYAKHVEYSEKNGKTPLSREEFARAAGPLRRAGVVSDDPGISGMATGASKFYDNHLKVLQEHGVPDADLIPPNPQFMKRVWDSPRVRDAINAAEDGEVERLISEAIRYQRPDIPKEAAPLIARAVVLRASRSDMHLADPTHELFSVQGKELADRIREDLAGLSDTFTKEQVETVARHIEAITDQADKPDATNPSSTKGRLDMDETYGAELKMKDGTTKWVNVAELLDQDIEHNVLASLHQSYGQAAFIEMTRSLFPFEEINTLSQFQRRLEKEAESLGKQPNQYKQDVDYLMAGAKRLLGVPQYETNAATRLLGMARDVNTGFFLSNPASGITQLAEAMDPLSWAGAKVTAKLMPELPSIIKQAATGNYTHAELKALEKIGLLANNLLTDRVSPRMDYEIGGTMSKAELATRKFAKFGSTVGGVRHAQAVIEAMDALAISMKFTEEGFGKGFSALELRDMGLEQAEADAIYRMIRKHGNLDELLTGVEKWDSPGAIAAFAKATDLLAKRQILKPNPAEQPAWMANSAVGKAIGQFRSFSFQAWNNKTLFALHHVREGDMGTFVRLGIQSAAAALAYAAGQGLKSIGKPNAEEYLDKKLSPEEILKASFSRAGYSSLIPMAVDTMANMTGNKDVFSGSRSTDLRGGILSGNPTYQMLSTFAGPIPRAIFAPVINPDYHFSQQDVNAIKNGAAPNVIGLRNAIEHLIEGLPATPVQQQTRP